MYWSRKEQKLQAPSKMGISPRTMEDSYKFIYGTERWLKQAVCMSFGSKKDDKENTIKNK